MPESSFFSELRKRKVVQTAAIYGAVSWGVTEVIVTVVEQLFLPQWVSTLAVIGFVVGFPIVMFLAWTFDLTSEGLRRTVVTSRRGKASIALSLVLLIAGTGGLFFLIRPALKQSEAPEAQIRIPPNSIAVLTFENAGFDPHDSYLSEGLSDELRDQLGRIKGIRISARSSSRAASERGLDALEASAKLGVATIVEGSLRHEGGVLRVSAQLIDGPTGLVLWAETYKRGPNELVLVQQEIADAVVRFLLPESEITTGEPATRDPTANELLLLARYYEEQVRGQQDVDENVLLEAVRLYREATETDPSSALAYSRLAGALLYLGDLDAAEAPIFRALSISPNLSEVQNTLGLFHWTRGQLGEAQAAWARAVELNPNNPDALLNYAVSRWHQINFEGLIQMLRRAVELDPLNLEPYATLSSYLAIEYNPDEARELVNDIEELFNSVASFRLIAQIHDYLGDVDKAIAWTIRARDIEPTNGAHVDKLAEYYIDIGDDETALELAPGHIGILFKMRRYQEMIPLAELAMIDEPQDIQLRSILAIAYNATGRYESAEHILSAVALPESVSDGWRVQGEWDGLIALVNALYGEGDIEAARDLARFSQEFGVMEPAYDWWWNIGNACNAAVLEQDDKARGLLERAQRGRRLPWDPILKDSPCFDRFPDDPVYRATVRHFDELRAAVRERLPATLAEYGVQL